MARIDIRSNGGGGSVATGVLQLLNGVALDATLRSVTDQNNTTSPLKLSTTAVQVNSPLRITTSDASGFYLDCEDGSGDNRFSIKRLPAAQDVSLDFASNPVQTDALVGSIRTYRDGVSLSETMSFLKDGKVGIGTNIPVGVLHLKTAAQNTRLAIDGDAGFNRLISYRTGAVQRFGLYVNNTAESGSNAGSDFAIRAYSDAGTLLNTPVFIKRSTGNVGINTLTGTAKLQVVGSGSTSATTSLLVQNSSSATSLEVKDDRTAQIYNTLRLVGTLGYTSNLLELRMNGGAITGGSINAFGQWNITNGGTNTTAAFIGTNVLRLGQNSDSPAIGFSDGLNVIGQWSGTAGTFNNTTNAEMIIKVNNTNASNLYGMTIAGDQVSGQLSSKNLLTLSHWGSSGVQTFGTTSAVQSYNLINVNISVSPTQPNKTLRGFYYNPAISGTALAANIAFQSTSGTVHVNTATPNATACLQADSTTQGFLPPRMTNVERAAITTPAIGLMVYCTDAVEGLYVYKSTGWTFVI